MGQIQVQSVLGPGHHIPPYLLAQYHNKDRDKQQQGGFLNQMMQMQAMKGDRSRQMRDMMMMQATAQAVREAFAAPQRREEYAHERGMQGEMIEALAGRESGQQASAERLAAGQRESTERMMRYQGNLSKELADAQTNRLMSLLTKEQTEKAGFQEQLVLAQKQQNISAETEEKRRAEEYARGKRVGLGDTLIAQERARTDYSKTQMAAEMTIMEEAYGNATIDLSKHSGKLQENLDVYAKESGLLEIMSTEATESVEYMKNAARELTTALGSENPTVVAANYEIAKEFLDRLEKSGQQLGGMSGLFAPFTHAIGVARGREKPSIWSDDDIAKLRSEVNDLGVRGRADIYKKQRRKLESEMAKETAKGLGRELNAMMDVTERSSPGLAEELRKINERELQQSLQPTDYAGGF